MKTIRILLLLLITYNALAQESVNYKVSTDEPRKVNNFSLNIDLAHMDFGIGNIDGASFNAGVWGHAMYKQRLGIDYTFRYGWLTFGKFANANAKNHINIQAGGFFIFHKNDRMTTNKVVLKSENAGYTSDGRAITRTTYLTVPSQKWKYKALRGGLYFNRSPFSTNVDGGSDLSGNYFMMGVYGGICFGTARHVIIQTDKYGEKGVVSHMRFCLDALITPVSNKPNGIQNPSPIGARFLVQALPCLRRKDRKGKMRTAMTAEVEVGYRMVDGLYLGGSLAIPISRSIKAFMSEGESQAPKRTAE